MALLLVVSVASHLKELLDIPVYIFKTVHLALWTQQHASWLS